MLITVHEIELNFKTDETTRLISMTHRPSSHTAMSVKGPEPRRFSVARHSTLYLKADL